MEEIWKTIDEFSNHQVSNLGRVKSLNYAKQGYEKILTPLKRGDGRLMIGFRKNGKYTQRRIHRLVAKTFISNPENKPQINHKNGIVTDNRIENLEWCTQSENMKHAYLNGLKSNIGDNCPARKLNSKIVKEIRQKYSKNRIKTQQEIADEYRINRTVIRDILNYNTWQEVTI